MSGTGRLVGVDVARAVALFGMFAAHVGDVPDLVDWSDPGTWAAVVHGRSSTLFAVLAGVSIALVSGRTDPVGRAGVGRVRVRLAIRAVLIVAVGVILMALATPVAVILPTYGALFLVVLPAIRWSRPALLTAAGGTVLLSVPAALATVPFYSGASSFATQLGLVYPVVTFLGYVLVGMAIGRSDLTDRRVQGMLVAVGGLLAIGAYAAGVWLAPIDPSAYSYPGVPTAGNAQTPRGAVLQELFSPRDHSSSIVDMVGTIGVAAAVIGLSTILFNGSSRRAHAVAWAIAPVAAAGSMPLSVYALHLVAIAVLRNGPAGLMDGAGTAVAFVLGAIGFAAVWSRFIGRGPLEAMLTVLSRPSPSPEVTAGPR